MAPYIYGFLIGWSLVSILTGVRKTDPWVMFLAGCLLSMKHYGLI